MVAVEYRPLTAADLPSARELWEQSFDDPAPFVDWYFGARFIPSQARGLFCQSLLVAMAQIVPYRMFLRGRLIPAIYIVGLSTRPPERGKGLASRLLSEILEELSAAGHGVTILKPAVPSFYRRRGWEYCYFLRNHLFDLAGNGCCGEFVEATPDDIPLLDKIYNSVFRSAHARLERTPDDWRALLYDHALDGGKAYLFSRPAEEPRGYLLVRPAGRELLVREMALEDPDITASALELSAFYHPGLSLHWTAWKAQTPPVKPVRTKDAPVMMGRIVNLVRALTDLSYPPDARLDYRFSVFDPLLSANNGSFRWRVDSGAASLTPIADEPDLPQVTVADLTTWIFGEPVAIPPEVAAVLPPCANYCNDLF